MREKWLYASALILLGACQGNRVRWEAPQAVLGDTLGAHLVTEAGSVEFKPTMVEVSPRDSLACPASFAFARDGSALYAAWMRRRADSSVAIVSARSDDGGQAWSTAAMVDSVDVGRMGCARPAPSIATAGGYVHVSYSMKAPEGYGVFFAHSMDRGLTFHWPMIVVYGDRLSETATAAHGMLVAVAYEDPSGSGKRIDVALSKTQGHTFEPRERASPDEMPATRPRIAITDSFVALSFAGLDEANRAIRLGRLSR